MKKLREDGKSGQSGGCRKTVTSAERAAGAISAFILTGTTGIDWIRRQTDKILKQHIHTLF